MTRRRETHDVPAIPPAAGLRETAALPPGRELRPRLRPRAWDHPQRISDRALAIGMEPLADDELLELLLLYSTPRPDARALARRLLERFGTLGDVLAAEADQLAEFDLDPRTVVHFKAMRDAARRLAGRTVRDRPVLTNWQQLIDYCHVALAHELTEQFRILFLDRKNVLIADERQQRGTIDHTPVYPREVIKRALVLNAAALILVHNHPSGDPRPSRDDIEMTREIKAAAEALGIALHDHLVIGRSGHASFRGLGLL